MNKRYAQIICEAHDINLMLSDEREIKRLMEDDLELLEAYEELYRYAYSKDPELNIFYDDKHKP